MLDPLTADTLKQAIAAAQSGDIQNARNMAEDALVQGGDIVALNAFLGMLRAREGDLAASINHLQLAHQGRPTDITIACNLISALIDSGDLPGAYEVATAGLADADPSLRVGRYRGYLAQSLSEFEEAVKAYELVVKHAPDDFESWNNLGNARHPLGDFAGSIEALERAMAIDPRAAPTRLNLASALASADRAEDAINVLNSAIRDFPDDARPYHELYVIYKRAQRQEEALAALENAVVLDPNSANLQFKLAVEYGIEMRPEDAEIAYRKTISLDPKMSDAYLGLVIQYEHTNRDEEFAPLLALAQSNGVDDGTVAFIEAYEHRRAGRFAEGLECLPRIPTDMEPERTSHIKATLLERLGHSEEAFTAFEQTALLHQENPNEPLRRAAAFRQQLQEEIDILTPAWHASWSSDSPASEREDPVFLVGFPRSGTTLLDTILMGHPGTHVLEEKPPLNHVDQALGGMAAIPALNEAAIIKARAQYFSEVDAIEGPVGDHLLVDKSPLFLHKVPLIQRLFPKARFILALRHPCDVLLSCFMSNFRLNEAMANFLRLEDAAEFYDITFRHWEQATAIMPVNFHTIVYEKLIEDAEAETRPLFDFLDLDWEADALDHQKTAKARGLVTTASYSQITEPIYKRAAGRWERYRDHLEPVLPVLKPWVEKFGYSL